jgi:hypothetical protein
MEIILELLWYLFVEFVGTAFFEAISEVIIRSARKILRIDKIPHPVFSFLGYIIVAFVLGSISIGIFKTHLVQSQAVQIASLILVPIAIGLLMSKRGKLLEKKNKEKIYLNNFIYAYSFALTFLLVRFFFIKN